MSYYLSSQYVGDPIDCHTNSKKWQGDDAAEMFDNYCWIEGTWTERERTPNGGGGGKDSEVEVLRFRPWIRIMSRIFRFSGIDYIL